MVAKFLENLEIFYKLLGPALLSMVVMFGLLGYFILDMYKFNVLHKIQDAFPSQFAIGFYFAFAVGAVVFIGAIISFQASLFSKDSGNPPSTPTAPPNASA
ncbi:hypothetical protein [Priestia megaterium]|uniref:hypothetical protein n=1 Tax=Priestia megaterium TaxID=1404 RepID=UPI0009903A22|nr:hypothetical protein [Priestia megaterium]AQU73805.1 hypothetical protein BUW91_11045 [Priestia megaterium]